MRAALLWTVAAVACLGTAVRAQEGAAFIEVTAPKRAYFVHEPIPLRLRIGVEKETFRRHAVPLFQRGMDVPIEVRAPWVDGLDGASALPWPSPAGPRLRFALNDDVAAGAASEVERGGRAFTVLTVDRRFLAEEPGTLAVQAPTLRWVYATRFRDDFLHGRRAADPRDVRVAGEALTLEIREVPGEGRPPGYVDAVGHFTLKAEVDRRRLKEKETLRLILRIEGEGNLETLTPPREIEGFHVFAVTDDRARPVRTLVFEIAPVGKDVHAVPAVPLHFLDPGEPPAYRVARTDAIPLEVERPPPPAEEGGGGGRRALWLGLLLGVAAALAALLVVRRARGGPRLDPEQARARVAAAELRAAAARPDADLTDAFAAYLAARLRCAPAAVVSPDLPARLRAAGVPDDLASRAAAALQAHVEARYGGARPRADLAALVGEMEAALGGGGA